MRKDSLFVALVAVCKSGLRHVPLICDETFHSLQQRREVLSHNLFEDLLYAQRIYAAMYEHVGIWRQ